MNIPAVSAAASSLPSVGPATPLAAPPEASFLDLFKDVVSDVSHLQDEARNAIDAFVRGEPIELHQVMAATEEASLSLEMLVEMRNRFVEAYRTIISV